MNGDGVTRRHLLAGAGAVGAGLALGPVAPLLATARTGPAEVWETPAGTLTARRVGLGTGRSRSTGTGPLGPGQVVAVDLDAPAQMVGILWHGAADATFALRSRRAGAWSPWLHVHGNPAEGPDGPPGRPGAGPVWVGPDPVDGVEVRLESGQARDVELDTMTWTAAPGPTRAATPRTVSAPATPAGGPALRLRDEWAPGGWRGDIAGCTPWPVAMSQLRFGIVHHTVSGNGYGAGDVPGILAGMYLFHTNGNGWCDIAYNFLVDRFGRVWQGRSGSVHEPVQGGHAQGFNTHSVGVALLGQHHPGASPPAAAVPAAALTAVRDVLVWKFGCHGVDPRATIAIVSRGSPRYPAGRTVQLPTVQGHRDSGLTSCPGDLAHRHLDEIRQGVAQRLAATADPQRWAPSATGPAFFGRLYRGAEGAAPTNGRPGRDTSRVVRDGASRDALATAIVFSTQTDERIGVVDRLYEAAFGRLAEGAGLAWWVAERDKGMAVLSMARSFTITAEFRTRYDHLDDRGYVAELYRNVFRREPDPPGWDYWVGRLAGGTSRSHVLASLAQSAEFRARTGTRVRVTTAYFVLLGRVPEEADRAYWSGRLDAGLSDQSFVAAVLRSPEYAAGA